MFSETFKVFAQFLHSAWRAVLIIILIQKEKHSCLFEFSWNKSGFSQASCKKSDKKGNMQIANWNNRPVAGLDPIHIKSGKKTAGCQFLF